MKNYGLFLWEGDDPGRFGFHHFLFGFDTLDELRETLKEYIFLLENESEYTITSPLYHCQIVDFGKLEIIGTDWSEIVTRESIVEIAKEAIKRSFD